jgi:hypothetical protein
MLLLNIIKAELLKYKRLYGVKILIFLSLFLILIPIISFKLLSDSNFETYQRFFDIMYSFVLILSLFITAYISDLI